MQVAKNSPRLWQASSELVLEPWVYQRRENGRSSGVRALLGFWRGAIAESISRRFARAKCLPGANWSDLHHDACAFDGLFFERWRGRLFLH